LAWSRAAIKDLRNAREQEDMAGECRFHYKYFDPTPGKQFAAVGLVKDVMVQAPVVEVVERAPVKPLRGARPWIHTDVVFVQDFWQMSEIVFLGVPFKILKHVIDRGGRSPVIEGFAIIRQN
jgi:hypothetical protein